MTEAQIEAVAARFKALGEPARLALVHHLNTHGELTVQGLVAVSGQKQANVSKHLAILARAGFVARRKEHPHVHYRLADPMIAALLTLVTPPA